MKIYGQLSNPQNREQLGWTGTRLESEKKIVESSSLDRYSKTPNNSQGHNLLELIFLLLD